MDYRINNHRNMGYTGGGLSNHHQLPNGGPGLLGNCSLPFQLSNNTRHLNNTVFNQMFQAGHHQPNQHHYQSNSAATKLMCRSGSGSNTFNAGLDHQHNASLAPPPSLHLFAPQNRPQHHPHATTLLQPSNPAAAMHQLLAAAAAAGLHPMQTNGTTLNDGSGSATNGAYPNPHLHSINGSVFPTATYQAFHPTGMFSASNPISNQPASSNGRDGSGQMMYPVAPQPTALYHTGAMSGTTLSSPSSVTNQAIHHQHHQTYPATSLIQTNFHVPYYQQTFNQMGNGLQRAGPQQPAPAQHQQHAAAIANAMAVARAVSSAQSNSVLANVDSCFGFTQPDSNLELNPVTSPSLVSVCNNDGSLVQPIYRSNGPAGGGGGDWWHSAAPS